MRFLVIAGMVIWPTAVKSEPFIPKSDQQVLERVRTTHTSRKEGDLRRWRAALAADPQNVRLATGLAARDIESSRAEGDPRYLGYARAALAPWWQAAQPPLGVQVLRATIKQSQHDFPNALLDLDDAIKTDPNCVQAWLTRATVLAVLGRYDEAREACVPLLRLAPRLVAVTALANTSSLQGEGEKSRQLLRSALERSGNSSERVWAWTVLAEINARLGHAIEAEADFRRALASGERDVYLLGAFADYLLDHNRPAEVIALLKNEERVDNLLLRLALAEARLQPAPASLPAHLAALQERFAASRLRGEVVHRREEARYELYLRHRPAEALQLAAANWEVQREPADARILIESALAAHEKAAAHPAIAFVSTNRLEDVQLRRLVRTGRLFP